MSIHYSRLKRVWDGLFGRHLLLTNTTLCVIFMGTGDIIQQFLEKYVSPEKEFDKNRTKNMMKVGAGFGVAGHNWYKFLDTKFPGKKSNTILKKLLAEGLVGPPLMLAFFLSVGYLEEKPIEKSYKDFKKNLLLVCIIDWGVYIPLQALNFYYLRPRYRFLYVCALTVVYDIFLSYVLHKDDEIKLLRNQSSTNVVKESASK